MQPAPTKSGQGYPLPVRLAKWWVTVRPTEYQAAYCVLVVEYGKQGKSLTWMAAELGVVKQTLHNWMDAHPEFLDAMTRAKQEAQRWWEDAGQQSMLLGPGQGTFNASVWSRSMAARFPDDWREASRTELTGASGGPLNIVGGLSAETASLLASLKAGPSSAGDAAPVPD